MPHASFWTRSALVLALSQAVFHVHAQPAEARAPVTAAVVEQKFSMLDKVLNHSPVAARIAASSDDRAGRHLANARELVQHARTLTGLGQLRGADALLNEAIYEVSRAQQLVPDPGTQQAIERARYAQLEDSLAALQRTALIALPQSGGVARADARAAQHVEQATQLARANKYIEANRQLDAAVLLLLRDASARLAGHTLVYDRKFASGREEFEFELARYESFERLVPLAVLELRPSPEAQALVDRNTAEARELRTAAQAAAARDPMLAIRKVTEGTDALRRALHAAGLVVPQSMENE